MTENRLGEITLAMELPLNRLDGLRAMLSDMVQQSEERQASIYHLLWRNLNPDLNEIRELWDELYALTCHPVEVPPLKAVEE